MVHLHYIPNVQPKSYAFCLCNNVMFYLHIVQQLHIVSGVSTYKSAEEFTTFHCSLQRNDATPLHMIHVTTKQIRQRKTAAQLCYWSYLKKEPLEKFGIILVLKSKDVAPHPAQAMEPSSAASQCTQPQGPINRGYSTEVICQGTDQDADIRNVNGLAVSCMDGKGIKWERSTFFASSSVKVHHPSRHKTSSVYCLRSWNNLCLCLLCGEIN